MSSFSSFAKRGLVARSEIAASTLLFLYLWYFWGVRYGDYLYAVQENSLFVFRNEFLTRWLSVPDGGLCYLTSFLIQFFYYPLLGGVLLALLGVAVQRSTARLLNWHDGAYVASFLPTFLLTIAATWHGYFVYIPFNVPLMFSSFLGVLFAYVGLGFYTVFELYFRRVFFGTLFIALGYLFFGSWSVFSGLLFAIYELTQQETNDVIWPRNIRRCFVSSAIAITIPLALQRFWLFPRLQIYNVFDVGMIENVRYERDSITALFAYGLVRITPLCVFALYLTARLLVFRSKFDCSDRTKKRLKKRLLRSEKKSATNKKRVISRKDDLSGESIEDKERSFEKRRAALPFELLFLLSVATFYASYHTRAFFDSLSACRALICSDWNRILEIDSKNPHPVGLMIGLRNFALFQTGRLAEEAFSRPIGFYQTRTLSLEEDAKALAGNPYYKAKVKFHKMKASTESQAHRAASELLMCYYGLSNVGARIATDNFVATEDRSVFCLKTLATAAIVNGEKELARRYLREISQTLFHKDWAKIRLAFLETRDFLEDVRDFNDDSEHMSEEIERRKNVASLLSISEAGSKFGVDVESLEQVRELIAQCRTLRPYSDDISNKNFPNLTYLIDVVKLNEYDDSPIKKKELILISALMQKKGDFFLEHVGDYLTLKGCAKGGAPRAIEQGYATWRYAQYDKKWRECEYQFTPETVEDMDGFIEFTKAFGSGPQQQVVLRRYCAGRYWGFASDDATYQNE